MKRGCLLMLLVAFGCGGATAGSEPKPEGQAGGGQAGRACPGVATPTPGEARCRSGDDCAPELWCQSSPPIECGPAFPSFTCSSDADCPSEARCVEVGPPSCSGQGRSTGCDAPCVETSCAEGDFCDADGHCRPVACDDGYQCSGGKVCSSGPVVDEHGCRAARCEDDELGCQAGFACQPSDWADVNGCAPISCHDGYECPVNQRCGDAGLFYHQCETLTCAEDADCDCGYCISGVCSSALYYCAKPPIG